MINKKILVIFSDFRSKSLFGFQRTGDKSMIFIIKKKRIVELYSLDR